MLSELANSVPRRKTELARSIDAAVLPRPPQLGHGVALSAARRRD